MGVAMLGATAVTMLASCGEDAEPVAAEPVKAPEKQATESTPAAVSEAPQKAEQMLDILLYRVVNRLSSQGLNSPFSAELREVLSLLNEYYAEVGEGLTGKPKKVELALLIADMRLNFRGYAEAVKEYDRALADYNALPEADRKNPQYTQWLSTIYYGKSSAQLRCGDRDGALATARQRLATDTARYETASADAPNTAQEIVAARDVLSSYRVLAELQMNSDPEEAREVFAKAVKEAEKIGRVPHVEVQTQYVRLLNAAAGHENACGDKQKALAYYTEAMKRCLVIYNGNQNRDVRNTFGTIYNNMLPLVNALKKELNPETPEAPAEDALPTEAPAEDAVPEVEAEPAA